MLGGGALRFLAILDILPRRWVANSLGPQVSSKMFMWVTACPCTHTKQVSLPNNSRLENMYALSSVK